MNAILSTLTLLALAAPSQTQGASAGTSVHLPAFGGNHGVATASGLRTMGVVRSTANAVHAQAIGVDPLRVAVSDSLGVRTPFGATTASYGLALDFRSGGYGGMSGLRGLRGGGMRGGGMRGGAFNPQGAVPTANMPAPRQPAWGSQQPSPMSMAPLGAVSMSPTQQMFARAR